jgi:hypothetical protein
MVFRLQTRYAADAATCLEICPHASLNAPRRLARLHFEPLCRLAIRQDVRMLARQGRNVRRFGGAQLVASAKVAGAPSSSKRRGRGGVYTAGCQRPSHPCASC